MTAGKAARLLARGPASMGTEAAAKKSQRKEWRQRWEGPEEREKRTKQEVRKAKRGKL